MLDGSNRSATATAVDATETMVLFRQGFLDFLGENPELDADVNTMLVQRLRNVNRMLGDMVFLDVPTRVAKQLLPWPRPMQKTQSLAIRSSFPWVRTNWPAGWGRPGNGEPGS